VDHLGVEASEGVGEEFGKAVVVVVEGPSGDSDAGADLAGGGGGPALLDERVDGGVSQSGLVLFTYVHKCM
jgi:hypothetical protein